ncbi:MAG TPA: hypothetical protein VFC14_09975 [Burkholderiales bacterium]|nr:hypothetical protein [Burkholderiales bacterium]
MQIGRVNIVLMQPPRRFTWAALFETLQKTNASSKPLYLHRFTCTALSAPLYLHRFICTALSAPLYLHRFI